MGERVQRDLPRPGRLIVRAGPPRRAASRLPGQIHRPVRRDAEHVLIVRGLRPLVEHRRRFRRRARQEHPRLKRRGRLRRQGGDVGRLDEAARAVERERASELA